MGRKCSVEGCLSDSARMEDMGVTFHKVPLHPDVRPKWISLCHIREDKKFVKIIYVCSRHFLRADFCNFKGKKYMLKQGVLPSVFPWDKSKLEAIKAEANKKEKIAEETNNIKIEPQETDNTKSEEAQTPQQEKNEESKKSKELEKSKLISPNTKTMSFAINSRIEALDFNNEWYPAKIVEVDYEENEVLIHFEKFSSKYDEWICMNSSRLRPIQSTGKKSMPEEHFIVGERCLAAWSERRRFPATVTRVMENDTYEVLFDDGFVKTVKANRMSKTISKIQSCPLFEPIKSSKQDRRDKKRKLNVAALFGKRPRVQASNEKNTNESNSAKVDEINSSPSVLKTSDDNIQNWRPQWSKGKPVGIDALIDTQDGPKSSIIVPDPRLPSGWEKHMLQRSQGSCIGKWDAIIVSPDNRKFRSRTDIKIYLEQHPIDGVHENRFDFSLGPYKKQKKSRATVKKAEESVAQPAAEAQEATAQDNQEDQEEDAVNSLKILFEDDAYKCPIEGCGKTFRRENLAQMHVKHYHPEYTKFLDSTPNVADLAYARTVGENLDRSPGPSKPPSLKPAIKTSTPKLSKLPQSPAPEMPELKPAINVNSSNASSKNKDSEIVKLLNSKPTHKRDSEQEQLSPSNSQANTCSDINLKDLLSKQENIPKRDDIKSVNMNRSSTGIKTLLPVVRQPTNESSAVNHLPPEEPSKPTNKRKRGYSENVEIIKGKTRQTSPPPPQLQPQIPLSQTSQPSPPSLPTASNTFHQNTPTLIPLSASIPPHPPLSEDSQFPPLPPNNIIIEGGEVIKIVRMKQEEIINCTCGFTEEDGLMIQCELCLCWQHAYCNNIERESQVPEKYICYICQNPLRERLSRKYYHDQDWMKQGILPTASYHAKDEEVLLKRFEKLKRCHDLSGGLQELSDYMHSLAMKLKIAEAKNHPKLYLWSKPWEKHDLPEKVKPEGEEIKPKLESEDNQYVKNENDKQDDSVLMMILKAGKEVMPKLDLNSLMDNNQMSAPIIPQPEAPIDSADCRLNLLEHIIHQESLVEERLDNFEKEIDSLEEGLDMERDVNYPKTRHTLQLLMRDLEKLKEFSHCTTI